MALWPLNSSMMALLDVQTVKSAMRSYRHFCTRPASRSREIGNRSSRDKIGTPSHVPTANFHSWAPLEETSSVLLSQKNGTSIYVDFRYAVKLFAHRITLPQCSYALRRPTKSLLTQSQYGTFEDSATSTFTTVTSSICSLEQTTRSAKTVSLVLQCQSSAMMTLRLFVETHTTDRKRRNDAKDSLETHRRRKLVEGPV
ncbi:uncharacterized protein MYCGRDRAFT_106390 [Zymoseptoria tritici IPO323]|uniref:Uncharacterized protein n=1 Tax=Zymoseptoria tritici (strain CBS 115943 / IPO323) TaxID=336722 RepID=F9XNZ1_ZYMTI|nr:uncharacterized protein MYCGRDRAFT_106390 [Zymoseptoria tritici IPO323]EGP82957.1 hypothetical protein MYCGRDRAFT_106390 [Zymoseptoria tritici IPO323]